ncbi:MAG: hypothetical protein JXQ29_14390 [Planctomycetes bacterium]|nr:hypothetical protein [Planctomycetota bacterium]
MKNAMLSVLVLLVLTTAAAGDEVYVPSNTPSTGRLNSFPYGSAGSEWRYQLVFNAALLGNRPFLVTEIAFAPSGTGTFTAGAFEVRMSHTTMATSATFDVNLPNPVTVLSTSNYAWQTTDQAWSPLGLTGSFPCNGVDRLTVEIRILGAARSVFTGQCYSEPGHHDRVWQYGQGAWSAPTGTFALASGLKTRFTVSAAQLILSGTGQPGTTVQLHLLAPSDGGKPYQVGTSLGNGPIPIGSRWLGLSPDTLLVVSLSGSLPAVFQHYTGMLDPSGQALAKLAIPNVPALKGVRLYNAFVTLDASAPQGLSLIAPTVLLTIL